MIIKLEISDKNVTNVVRGLGIENQYSDEQTAIESCLINILLGAAKENIKQVKQIEIDQLIRSEVSDIDIKSSK